MIERFEPRECTNCSELFTCRGDMYSWCIKVEVPEKVQEYIAARFEGACVKIVSSNKLKTLKQKDRNN